MKRPEPLTEVEVDDYVQMVRLYLGDLDDQTRDELTDGLPADLADLVADHGTEALADPEVYAEELRAAAGLDPRPGTSGTDHSSPRRLLEHSDALLDEAGRRVWRTVDSRAARTVASYAVDLRPMWWLVRGQVAFWAWQTATAGQNGITLLPWQRAAESFKDGYSETVDTVVWLVVMALSLRVGRMARRGLRTPPRLWLLAANSTAALSVLYFLDRLENVYYWLW